MYCQKCGSQNPDGAAFCQSCGAQMAPPSPPAAPVAPGRPPTPVPPRPRPVPSSETVALGPLRIPRSFVDFSQYLLPAAAAFMFLGSFLPWVRVFGFGSVNGWQAGVHRLGILTFFLSLALGAGYAALRVLPRQQTANQNARLGALVGLAVILLCVVGIGISVGSDVNEANDFMRLAGVGIGFHMTWLGALMACVGGLWIWMRE